MLDRRYDALRPLDVKRVSFIYHIVVEILTGSLLLLKMR